MYGFNRPWGCCCCPQVKPCVKVVHRYFYRDVPHVCPYHTHVVNHKVCCHRFIPQFTCSQEAVCKDVCC